MILSADCHRFEPDHRFTRPREFPHWTVEVTTSGAMLRRSGSQPRHRPQPANVLILSPPGLLYDLRGRIGGWEAWAIFRPREPLLPHLDWPRHQDGTRRLPLPDTHGGRAILQTFETLHNHLASNRPARHLLAEMLLDTLLLQTALEAEAPASRNDDERIARVIRHLENHAAEPHTVAELARLAHLSPSRFAHLFRERTGHAPMAYLERLRMEHAQRLLLHSNRRIQEIADEVGFRDPFHFSTRFRKYTGRPPSHWRQHPE